MLIEDHFDFPVTVLIGFIFVACVLLFRRGIAGEMIEWMRKRSASHPK
jgi:branched-chain amino acid transport system permease protein